MQDSRFSDVIRSEAQLREVVGHPGGIAAKKSMTQLNDLCRDFIARSPFLLIASSDAEGSMDISPKGDPPGFVHVLDDSTLLIPDRPGNRRADTFSNILQHPKIGLLFLVPGQKETLRVSGEAQIIRDAHWREQMAVQGKIPELLIALNIQEVFFHCPKCIARSGLWDSETASAFDTLPFLAQTVVKQGLLDRSVEEIEAMIEEEIRDELY